MYILGKMRNWVGKIRSGLSAADSAVAFGGCAVFLFFLTFVLDVYRDRTIYQEVDVGAFQREFRQKEQYAWKTLEEIRTMLTEKGVEGVSARRSLYSESMNRQVAFQIYKGNKLLYWSDRNVSIRSLDDFEFEKEFFFKADNALVVVAQTFVREYRCVALIKIKDRFFHKKNSPHNHFARSFGIPGSVVVLPMGDGGVRGVPIRSESGRALFTLSNTKYQSDRVPVTVSCLFFWLLATFCLIQCVDSAVSVAEEKYPKKKGVFVWVGVGVLLLLTLVSAVTHFPDFWYGNPLTVGFTFRSANGSTLSHLYLYLFSLWGIILLVKRHCTVCRLHEVLSGWRLTAAIAGVKTVPILLACAFISMMRDLVMSSEMNVAVSFVQDVSVETLFLLLFAFVLSYLFFSALGVVRKFYADKGNVGQIVAIHFVLTIAVVCGYAAQDCWVEALCALVGTAVILFADIYSIYYEVNSFLYATPIAFIFVNVIIGLSYHYSEMKNERTFKSMAYDVSRRDCVIRDDVAESVLVDRSKLLLADSCCTSRVGGRTDEDLTAYVRDIYFVPFADKYDLEIQTCGPLDTLVLRKVNYKQMLFPNHRYLENKFRRLDGSIFYANKDEALGVSFLGKIPLPGDSAVYLKFYRTVGYDRVSFLEQSVHGSLANQPSQAKYLDGELSYFDGDFHYPAQMAWLEPESHVEADYVVSVNQYKHYVHKFKRGKSCSVVSVPERQSYAYVILMTYLFAVYVIYSLVYFAFQQMWKGFLKKRKSVLNRMQLIFVGPLLVAFVVLATASVPFFIGQMRKAQFAELREKSMSVQQSLQHLVELSSDMKSVKSLLFPEIKKLSNQFHTDILLYDREGKLLMSSRPLFVAVGRRQSNLMEPKVFFGVVSDDVLLEQVGKVSCYAWYVRAFNLQNVDIGYIHLQSQKAYESVRNDIVNLWTVVLDIYLFVSVFSIFVIWLLNRSTTRPLRLLTERFAQIQLTGENNPIPYANEDEIGDLVKQYNKMAKELKVQADKLSRAEREFAWREMARRIAHEIKNPLTPMRLSVQQCLRKQQLDPEHFDEYFQNTAKILIDQIDNLANIASEFSSFAKVSEARPCQMDIVAKLRSTVDLFVNNSEDVSFTLNLNGCTCEYIWMDDKQVLQVFNNLFRNAIQSIPPDRPGRVEVSFNREGDVAYVRVKDNGCGISDEVRERMFEPNFTTKTSGMGLGLAIVKGILLSMGGDIWFETELGVGTTFILKFPIYKG